MMIRFKYTNLEIIELFCLIEMIYIQAFLCGVEKNDDWFDLFEDWNVLNGDGVDFDDEINNVTHIQIACFIIRCD